MRCRISSRSPRTRGTPSAWRAGNGFATCASPPTSRKRALQRAREHVELRERPAGAREGAEARSAPMFDDARPKVMQELAGHYSSQITMDIYTHVNMDAKKEAVAAVSKIF